MDLFKKANKLNVGWVTALVSNFIRGDGETGTETNIEYFLNFNDPTEPEIQMGVMNLAVYEYAKTCLKDSGVSESSAVDIWDFMRERPKHSP